MRTAHRLFGLVAFACLLQAATIATAALPPHPQISYVYPPVVASGSTTNVQLAGALWTPDLQFFVHDERIRLEVTGRLSPLLMPKPPYFIGTKAYYPPPLPQEVSARIVIPPGMPPGPVHWQVANANGSSDAGVFFIGDGTEVLEQDNAAQTQLLDKLPVTILGRLSRNEEIDTYRFRADRRGPITCKLTARELGSQFNGLLEIRDGEGRLIADRVDTQGTDLVLTFSAKEREEYTVALRDLDFRGNRAFVYRLAIKAAPHVVTAIPAGGRAGETRAVEFLGIGLATGGPELESVRQLVTFPTGNEKQSLNYQVKTEFGNADSFPLTVDEWPHLIETETHELSAPVTVTGILDKPGQLDRYKLVAKKESQWEIKAFARSSAAPLDVNIAVIGPNGERLAENDDSPGSTDSVLLWTAPADGDYEIVVGDSSGNSGQRTAVYRLTVTAPQPDFRLTIPQRQNVVLGGKSELSIKAIRSGGLNVPIVLTLSGLPLGVSAAHELVIPADKDELKIELQAAANLAVTAALVDVTGTAELEGHTLTRSASAPAFGGRLKKILIATTMKPRFQIEPVESDERTVHRGSTHLAAIGIERLEGFDDPIVVKMDSIQPHKFRQGLFGPDVVVPAGANQVFFPCFVPERSETLDAYRMLLTATAEVADPQGNKRWLISRMPAPDNSIAITVEGALLKIGLRESQKNVTVGAGQPLSIPIRILRSAKLTGPVQLEVIYPDQLAGFPKSAPVDVAPDQDEVTLQLSAPTDDVSRLSELENITIRATAIQPAQLPALDEQTKTTPLASEMLSILKSGHLPVISEIQVPVKFVAERPREQTSNLKP